MFCARHFFVTISLDVTISASCNWSVAVFTTSSESQESYLTLRNVTLQTRLSITRDFFRQHGTFARLYNAAASPASRPCSAGSLAINNIKIYNNDNVNSRVILSKKMFLSTAAIKIIIRNVSYYYRESIEMHCH